MFKSICGDVLTFICACDSLQELQLYFDKVSEVLLNGAAAAAAAAQPPAGAGLQGAAAAELASKAQDGAPEHLERAVFASLSTDPGEGLVCFSLSRIDMKPRHSVSSELAKLPVHKQ